MIFQASFKQILFDVAWRSVLGSFLCLSLFSQPLIPCLLHFMVCCQVWVVVRGTGSVPLMTNLMGHTHASAGVSNWLTCRHLLAMTSLVTLGGQGERHYHWIFEWSLEWRSIRVINLADEGLNLERGSAGPGEARDLLYFGGSSCEGREY